MAGSCKLSAEQLKRIEENRRRARDRLFRNTAEQPAKNPPHDLSTAFPQPFHRQNVVHSITNHTTANSRPPSYYDKSFGATSSVSTADTASKKVVELVRPTVKGNLRLVSKQRFEIVIPYDRLAIEVFKKTPTNAYGQETV